MIIMRRWMKHGYVTLICITYLIKLTCQPVSLPVSSIIARYKILTFINASEDKAIEANVDLLVEGLLVSWIPPARGAGFRTAMAGNILIVIKFRY